MYRIFIVEDDEIIANLLKKNLCSWGYEISCAEDFSNIIQDFARLDPQLILLDLKLPFYNGFHWCEEIRKVSQVPVIFISSVSGYNIQKLKDLLWNMLQRENPENR